MLIQRVLMPGSGRESWTLLGDDGEVIEPAERYLAYLTAIERSPNTVRAYAVSLKLWFEFLQHAVTSWDEAGVEDVARFVAWLRAPAGNVIVLAGGTGVRSRRRSTGIWPGCSASMTTMRAPACRSLPGWSRGGGSAGVRISRSCIT